MIALVLWKTVRHSWIGPAGGEGGIRRFAPKIFLESHVPMVGEIPALAGFSLHGQETFSPGYGAFFPLGPSWLGITCPEVKGWCADLSC